MSQSEYLKKYHKKKRFIKIMQFLILIGFLLLWQILSYKGIINSFIYSSPYKVFLTIKNLIISKELFIHVLTTLKEIFISFLLGISLGLLISILFYECPTLAKIFDPYLTILNSLPKVALGPIIIIIAGANMKSIINLIVSIISIYSGLKETDKVRLKMFDTFKASKWQKLKYLVLPSAYNSIISSLKLNISLTLVGVITGEFLVSKSGIGYLIIYGTQVFNLSLVISGIIILLIISYLLYKLIIILEKKLLKNLV